MRIIFFKILIIRCLLPFDLLAQGPPILLDKPIMLGEKKGTVRPIFKRVDNKKHDFNAFILDADYNFSNNLATMIELPYTFGAHGASIGLGDISVGLKYQFFRKDGMGKTTRIAAKIKNMFQTGKDLETMTLGMGHNMTYVGILAAKETLRLGIQSEIGYNFVPSATHLANIDYKLGFGIPLLAPVYPVKQVNIYVEIEGMHMKKHLGEAQYAYYLAPGLQYAKGLYTFEASYQFPIQQQLHVATLERKSSLQIGVRRII